jgi:hypothetical protein
MYAEIGNWKRAEEKYLLARDTYQQLWSIDADRYGDDFASSLVSLAVAQLHDQVSNAEACLSLNRAKSVAQTQAMRDTVSKESATCVQ